MTAATSETGGEEGRANGSFAFPPSRSSSLEPLKATSSSASASASALTSASSAVTSSYPLHSPPPAHPLSLPVSSLSSYLPPLSLLPSSVTQPLYFSQLSSLSSYPLLQPFPSHAPSMQRPMGPPMGSSAALPSTVSELLASLSYTASQHAGPPSFSLQLQPSLSHPQPLPLSLSPFLYGGPSSSSSSPMQLYSAASSTSLSPSLFPSSGPTTLFSPPLRPLPTSATSFSAPHHFLALNNSSAPGATSASSLSFYGFCHSPFAVFSHRPCATVLLLFRLAGLRNFFCVVRRPSVFLVVRFRIAVRLSVAFRLRLPASAAASIRCPLIVPSLLDCRHSAPDGLLPLVDFSVHYLLRRSADAAFHFPVAAVAVADLPDTRGGRRCLVLLFLAASCPSHRRSRVLSPRQQSEGGATQLRGHY